ncbi:MAG: ATP-dependent zinc metalloprotease FtsH [Dehalococcoidia bacterium]|nr:ATP-dependent zinc metalloprotease FtsH [Dehalococcoidia bacterium]
MWVAVILAVSFILFSFIRPQSEKIEEAPLSEVIVMAHNGNIASIEVKKNELHIITTSGDEIKSYKESDDNVRELLTAAGVKIEDGSLKLTVKPDESNIWNQLLLSLIPLLILGGILFYMFRGAKGAGNQVFSLGKSKARMFTGTKSMVSFTDVAGMDESKQELEEVVDFLKQPGKFLALGARIPRGVLLVGLPGTGKTLLAKAVAGEAGVPFFSISGSEFVEMFVGVGASRVRDLFEQAKRNAPAIIFIDEIDAVGRQRGTGLGGGHDEREQTLNQILVEMDGFESSTNVIVIAATNRADVLDPALLRPGRFDRQVTTDLPSINGRKAILEVHIKGKPLQKESDLDVMAKQTYGFSGADLANLLNEAAILSARRDKKEITLSELEEAFERIVAGPERKSFVISLKEKEITAYHEAGHALVAHMIPGTDPVHKVTIIARGAMGGYTMQLPLEDRRLVSRSDLRKKIAILLAGQVAESIQFNDMTTGSSNDIEMATSMVRKMVTEYGMSDKLGPRTFGHKQDMIVLGRDIASQRDYGDRVADEIDKEVAALIDKGHKTAYDILTKNRVKLSRIAEYLVAHEMVEGKELKKLFDEPASDVQIEEQPAS